jgi:surfeit locus 1 family protein
MTAVRGRFRAGLAVPVLFVLAAVASFIALGTWQLERKAWKEALIATLDRRLSAQPTPLPPPEDWSKLDPADDEFRRVSFSATIISGAHALVYTVGLVSHGEMAEPGYWVFAPARLAGGYLLAINRGFVPDRGKDPETLAAPTGGVDMVGTMRWPEPRGFFTPADEPARNLWFVRDHLAMAAAKGWQGRDGQQIAPFFIDLERPVPPGGLPRPVPPGVNLRNAHLQYAITWYGLAAVVIVMFLFWLKNRKEMA